MRLSQSRLKLWVTLAMLMAGPTFVVQGVFAAGECSSLFSQFTKPSPESVDKSIRALAELKVTLDLKKVDGKSTIEFTALSANYIAKEKELLQVLTANKIMTRDELVIRIKNEIKEIQSQDKTKNPKEEKIKKETKRLEQSVVNGAYVIMNRVEPGTFQMGGKQVFVEITKPFDLMATLTTQHIWREVFNLSTTLHVKLENDIGSLYADPSHNVGPLHPVEGISRIDIQDWLEILNKLSLHPAAQAPLRDLIPDHKQGDIYRLPTEAEWEYVARLAVKEDLLPYGWFSSNAEGSTQPVATKEPMTVYGRKYYDLFGNVYQWMADGYSLLVPGGKDPLVDPALDRGVLRGGSVITIPLNNQLASDRTQRRTGEPAGSVGFRLVREVRP